MSEPTPKQPPTQEQQQQPETPTWQTLVAKKQAECASKVPPEWLLSEDLLATLPLTSAEGVNLIAADVPRKSGLLSELELEITEKYTAKELVQKLATGEFKSVDVTRAFCKRAAIAQQLVFPLSLSLVQQTLTITITLTHTNNTIDILPNRNLLPPRPRKSRIPRHLPQKRR